MLYSKKTTRILSLKTLYPDFKKQEDVRRYGLSIAPVK